MSSDSSNNRTLAELLIHLGIVHIVTAVNYAYLSKTQRRSVEGWKGAVRVVFFIFAPTIALVELVVNSLRALDNFVRDELDREQPNKQFYVSALLGIHAAPGPSAPDDIREHEPENVPLLDLSRIQCDREIYNIDWTWLARLIISTFTLIQGLGTAINWIVRIVGNMEFGLDDRNGLMGIVTTGISIQCILILLTRSKWTINQPLPPTTVTVGGGRQNSFIYLAFFALIIQNFARANNYNDDVGHSPTMIFFFLPMWLTYISLWPAFILAIYLVLIRREIWEKFQTYMIKRRLGDMAIARIQAFIRAVFVVIVIADVAVKLADDIAQVVHHPPGSDSWGWDFWQQTPLGQWVPGL